MPVALPTDRDASVVSQHNDETVVCRNPPHVAGTLAEQTLGPVSEKTIQRPAVPQAATDDERTTVDAAPATVTEDRPTALDSKRTVSADPRKMQLLMVGVGVVGTLAVLGLLYVLFG